MAKGKTSSAKLPQNGYTHQTPQYYLLNAGLWVKNLEWNKEDKKWSYDRMGATSGGSTITLKNEYRQVEIDGAPAGTVGSDMIESMECTAEMNLLEITVDNLKMAVLADQSMSDGSEFPEKFTILRPRSKVKNEDYITNLAYVGTMSGSDDPIIIIFHQAICTSGLELSPADKAEGVMTVTFEGRSGACDLDQSAMPVTILFPEIKELEPPKCGNTE